MQPNLEWVSEDRIDLVPVSATLDCEHVVIESDGDYVVIVPQELTSLINFLTQAHSLCYPLHNKAGRFLQTFSGKAFYPLSPRAEDVCIEDIAHSLSMQCRYNGHCAVFYSVAEHCCLLYDYVQHRFEDPTISWWALMHDSSESIVGDLIRPVKDALPAFADMEKPVMDEICDAFGMKTKEMPTIIHELDKRIIADERTNMKPMDWGDFEVEPLGVELKLWSPARAKEEFLKRFDEIKLTTGDSR